jgi:thiamine-phosphate pyrophosphorylase
MAARGSDRDVGKEIYGRELKRKNIRDIFFANMQRIKESVRVLEEFTKLIDTASAIKFKRIRYEVYGIEKRTFLKIQ